MNGLLSASDREAFERHGHILLPQVLQPAYLAELEPELTDVVRRVYAARFSAQFERDYGCSPSELLAGRKRSASGSKAASDTYARAFTQRPNLWRYSAAAARLVKNKTLAQLAAELLGVAGVRLYHDQALYKEAGGGYTPWHVDQFYWPLSSDRTVTAWIPLQDVPLEMGPVAFASGSHTAAIRDTASRLAISDESEAALAELVRDLPVCEQSYRLGDVSFHSGWTCHRAGPNGTDRVRAAFTIIYMDMDIEMIEPEHDNHRADAALWLPGVRAAEVAASPLNPVLYDRAKEG